MADAVFVHEGFREVDGRWTGYFGGIALTRGIGGRYSYEGGSPALYAVDVATNLARRVTTSPNDDETLDWFIDPDGEVASTLAFNDTSGNWRLLDRHGRTLASGTAMNGSGQVVAYSADGTGLVYAIHPEHSTGTFYQVPLAGGEPQVLFDGLDTDLVYLDPLSGRMIGYRPGRGDGADDAEALHNPVFFDPVAQQRVGTVITSFQQVGGTVRGWTPDFARVLVYTSGNNDPGTWFLVDTVAGQASVIGRARPQIRPDQVGPISTVTYTAQDGTRSRRC